MASHKMTLVHPWDHHAIPQLINELLLWKVLVSCQINTSNSSNMESLLHHRVVPLLIVNIITMVINTTKTILPGLTAIMNVLEATGLDRIFRLTSTTKNDQIITMHPLIIILITTMFRDPTSHWYDLSSPIHLVWKRNNAKTDPVATPKGTPTTLFAKSTTLQEEEMMVLEPCRSNGNNNYDTVLMLLRPTTITTTTNESVAPTTTTLLNAPLHPHRLMVVILSTVVETYHLSQKKQMTVDCLHLIMIMTS
jgi:hypothetical protein